jgi:NAD(P)-dependent dehydrogenase (short-subunit alcohol dehydrogenase family)
MGLVEGKSGVVTGAGSGIGRACAVRFAAEGACVVVSDLEDRRADGEETVALIEEAGGQATFVSCDVRSASDQERLVAECLSRFGRLDFAHNNAGIGQLQALIEETEEALWHTVLDVNLTGVWLGMRAQVPAMRAQGGGSIVNTASLAGLTGMPKLAPYVASKHGVVGLTKALAFETGDAGIRVNCICPSAVRTPTMDQRGPERQARLFAGNAIKRLGEPDEAAGAVVWLASDASSLVTGAALAVDLGASAGFDP